MKHIENNIGNIIDNEIISFIKLNENKQQLNEILTDVVYHYTTISSVYKILETNTIYLTPSFATNDERDLDSRKYYYMSLTTSKHSDVGYQSLTPQNLVRITLNGRLLNSNYKSTRVDYWKAPKDPQNPKFANTTKEYVRTYITKHDEMEERIISNNNEIPNIAKYIISIDILITDYIVNNIKLYNENPNNLDSTHQIMGVNRCKQILFDCIQKNVPCYFYDNKNYFNAKQTNKNINNIIKPENTANKTNDKLDNNYAEAESVIYMQVIYKTLALVLYNNKNKNLYDDIINTMQNIIKNKDILEKANSSLNEEIRKLNQYRMPNVIDFTLNYLKNNNIQNPKQISDQQFKEIVSDENSRPFTYYATELKMDISNTRTIKNPFLKYSIKLLVLDMRAFKTTNLYTYIMLKALS